MGEGRHATLNRMRGMRESRVEEMRGCKGCWSGGFMGKLKGKAVGVCEGCCTGEGVTQGKTNVIRRRGC